MRKINDIDKNFAINSNVDVEDKVFYDITQPPFDLKGVFYDKERGMFCRMPQDLADKVSFGVKNLNTHTAGGRLRFSTDSKTLTVSMKIEVLASNPQMTLLATTGFSLCKNVDGKEVFVSSVLPKFTDENGYVRQINLDGTMSEYTLYFPLYDYIFELNLGFDKDAKVLEGKKYKDISPILYYGSSITQGGCASRPDTCYESLILKNNNVDYVNLGFSGNAKAEEVLIDYLTEIECSVFVMDYDHNAPTVEFLNDTHFSAYTRYRAKKPDTPIIFISRPNYYPNEQDSKARLKVIRSTYNKAKAMGDNNVYLIDGSTFFKDEWAICTVDGTHPTDLGFYKMAKIIGRKINKILNI